MRGLRYLLPAMTLVGTLTLWAGAASANSHSFSATINNAWSQDNNSQSNPNGDCSGAVGGSPSPAFGMGYPYGTNNAGYTQWAFGSWNAAVGVPAGATLTDATLSGAVSESTMNGYTAPAGSYGLNVGAGAGSPWLSGRNSGCYYPIAYGLGDSFTPSFPGNTSPVSFSGDAYNLARTYVTDGSGDVYLATGDWQLPQGLWMAPASSLTLTVDYAFTPSGISVYQPLAGNGTQVAVSWNPHGDWGGTTYALQRETLASGGVAAGWATIYQGTATSFTTGDQSCGVGYVYRVQAVGAHAGTPWDTSGEWDEYPCSESFVRATTTSVTVSWPEVTPNTVPDIVWCEEGTPAGGVSCGQRSFQIGAGATSATITGLVPDAEYAVWACSATNAWGCPEVNVWTYAAVPELSPDNNVSGLAYDQQPFTWTGNGNAPGTVYQFQQGTYAASGAWQGGTVIYQGTGTSFTAKQAAGAGYSYNVWAVNAGYGTGSGASNGVAVQVASTPTLTITGATTASVSWLPVAYMSTTGVACNIDGTGDWFYPGPATGGATSLSVTGLQPNTQYYCATYAVTSNQGIQWWQGANAAYTLANPPSVLSIRDETSPWAPPQALFSWRANGNPGGTTYSVSEQTFAPDGQWSQSPQTICVTTATSCPSSDVRWGTVHAFYVDAENGSGQWTAWAGPMWWATAPQPTVTAAGSTSLAVSWPALGNGAHSEVYWNEVGQPCCGNSGDLGTGATSHTISGLLPNTRYSVSLMVWIPEAGGDWCGGGACWWEGTGPVYTAPNPPGSPALTGVGQTGLTVIWSADGDPSGTEYHAVLYACSNTTSPVADSGWVTAQSWTPSGVSPGTCYVAWVQARNGSGATTAVVWTPQVTTVPAEPTITGRDGGLGWSPTSGRGYVTLSWPPSPGATGYTLYVWDGVSYEAFDLGDATSWDSRTAAIYSPDASLYPNVTEASKSPPVLAHSAGGLNLRDQPLDLYCTTGTQYCSTSPADNYWFTVAAYNGAGSSAGFQVPGQSASSYYEPTLPLQTDPAAPTITGWSVNDGGGYTYSSTVSVNLDAAEGTSGIAAYALSNDGSTWKTTAVAACTLGQVAPCGTSLVASGKWTLLPGPGSKTVWAKVESTAGVWSAPEETTVYVNVDQTVPMLDVTLDGGAGTTTHTSVTVAVSVSDPVTQNTSLTWQVRYSSDGGQTWSSWQPEGTATSWSTPWTIPGGASGERTVLAQVENNDDDLGQGGATIYYAAPGSGGGAALPPGTGGNGHACVWPVNGTDVPATCVTSSQVTVPLTTPASAVEMRVSLDDATWGPWQATAASVAVDLGASAGAKTVWVEYRDDAGTVTAESPIYYVYDPAGPSVRASWAGSASATDGGGHATLDLQVSDDVGTTGMTVTVTENGTRIYSGAYRNTLPLTLTGSGYQLVQVAVTDVGGNQTGTQLGIYVF